MLCHAYYCTLTIARLLLHAYYTRWQVRPAVNDLEHETENAEAESANARLVYMLLWQVLIRLYSKSIICARCYSTYDKLTIKQQTTLETTL